MERIRNGMKDGGDTEGESGPSRRSSIQMKRRSLIRMISENDALMEQDEESSSALDESTEDELLRQEAEEAKQLAEDWENKYKEMQRQMKDIESGGKHHMTKKPPQSPSLDSQMQWKMILWMPKDSARAKMGTMKRTGWPRERSTPSSRS
ncbi:Putative LOC100116551 [Caligus rogercresseyi]|uniref:LOC100116551 n=1 Tax=Caligus rogercresseyi TaxID=217165 RepID=A0A7T8GSB8_CALRO|nr:Putative LOC100116551 [Caligus rogercresseyi]